MLRRFIIKAHPSQLELPPITCEMLLEIFPFGLIIRNDPKRNEMLITGAGEKLIEAWMANNDYQSPEILINSVVTDYFKLRRPTGILFNWATVRDVIDLLSMIGV